MKDQSKRPAPRSRLARLASMVSMLPDGSYKMSLTQAAEIIKRMVEQFETNLKMAFDFGTPTQSENEYLMDLLRQHGIDPWVLPGEDAGD